MTSTENAQDFSKMTRWLAPYDLVVSGEDRYVYLMTQREDAKRLLSLRGWKDCLPTLGLKMRTGLTVAYRHKEALRNKKEAKTVPLFCAQHLKGGEISFPLGSKNEYLRTERQGLLQNNEHYLFVKRCTAKEETRRLQCAVYLSSAYPEHRQISTDNKVNFIGAGQSKALVYGLYVLFNSSLYDAYYRILNGSTQVNASEINKMPIPPKNTLLAMGEALMARGDLSSLACDEILEVYL